MLSLSGKHCFKKGAGCGVQRLPQDLLRQNLFTKYSCDVINGLTPNVRIVFVGAATAHALYRHHLNKVYLTVERTSMISGVTHDLPPCTDIQYLRPCPSRTQHLLIVSLLATRTAKQTTLPKAFARTNAVHINVTYK